MSGPPDEHDTPGDPPPPPRELPRGCNPLVFGVVMATLEMAALLVLWQRCT